MNRLDYEKAKTRIKEHFPHGCSRREYIEWSKTPDFPDDLPKGPDDFYRRRHEWINWADFGGKGNVKNTRKDEYPDYESARKLVRQRFPNGCNRDQYWKWVRARSDLPRDPPSFYGIRGSWKGWPHYLNKPIPTKQGYVYVIVNPIWPDYVKIGICAPDQVKNRISSYNIYDPHRSFRMIHKEWFENRRLAEICIHRSFRGFDANNKEWFKIPAVLAIKRIQIVHKLCQDLMGQIGMYTEDIPEGYTFSQDVITELERHAEETVALMGEARRFKFDTDSIL